MGTEFWLYVICIAFIVLLIWGWLAVIRNDKSGWGIAFYPIELVFIMIGAMFEL